MKDGKIADLYIKTIGKITKNNMRHIAFAPILLFSVLTNPEKFPIVILLEAAFLFAYYLKYFEASSVNGDSNLVTALRGQSFPAKAVIKKLAARVLPFEIFFFVYCVLLSFVKIEGGVDGFAEHVHPQSFAGFNSLADITAMQIANIVCWPLLCVLVPVLYLRLTEYRMTHEKNGISFRFFVGAAYFIFDIVTYLIGIIIGAFAFLIITALIIDAFIEIPQDRAVLYAFGSNNRAYMIVAMISMMLWIAFMLRNEIRKFKIGRLNFRIALFAAGVIATTLMIVYSCRNYVKIDDDSMISIEKGAETTYSFDDVTDFKIYCNSDSLALRVSLTDGKKLELLSDMTEESESWSDEYENYYHFTEAVAKKLREKGIEGSLDDVDELEDNVKDMDKEAKASFERIKEMFA